jgi:molecular chaperone DnaJ
LHYDLYISFSEAVLGVSKDIEAINGVRIKLKKVFNQENLKIKRKGIQVSMVMVTRFISSYVWTPKTLNKDQKNNFLKKHDG